MKRLILTFVLLLAFPAFGAFPAFMAVTNGTAPPPAPVNTSVPTITGTSPPQVGSTLTGSTGTWTQSPTSYAYQWNGNGTPISGATASTYTPVTGDIGHTITVTVTASNGAGNSSPATSSATSAVIAASGSVAFTALHTYFISPTGSGSTCSSASPCATPNAHASVCGDVWIAATGTYTSAINITTQPTGCPSTTGGIDGTGGIYMAVLVCKTAFGCNIANSGISGGNALIQVEQVNNWAVEGFVGTTSGGNAGCFDSQVDGVTTLAIHHIAFINNQCNNSGLGFFTAGFTPPGPPGPPGGTDYFALVGNLAYTSNQRSDFPSAAFVDVAPKNSDTNAGIHVSFIGNFSVYNQVVAISTAYSDVEGMMFDTFDDSAYVGTSVIRNNVIYASSWAGLQIFMQAYQSSNPDIEIQQNTIFGDWACVPNAFPVGAFGGELNMQLDGGFPWTINVYNNILMANRAIAGCDQSMGGAVYAMATGGGAPGVGSTVVNNGGIGLQNFMWNSTTQPTCVSGSCSTGNYQTVFNGFPLGTNTYANPSFKNTADLLSNHIAQPNCTGFANVAACMGWNNGSQTATALSVIDDLAASASGVSGKGYQPPGACAPDSLYPTWLKGIVYLEVDASNNVTENAGLVQKPCGV